MKFFIVGRGEGKKDLMAQIKKHNLIDKVFIFSDVADGDLVYYYKLADIFVMTHRQLADDIEGLGICPVKTRIHNSNQVTLNLNLSIFIIPIIITVYRNC